MKWEKVRKTAINMDSIRKNSSAAAGDAPSPPAYLQFFVTEMLEILIEISEIQHTYSIIASIFAPLLKDFPDFLFVALAQLKRIQGGGHLLDELFSVLFPLILNSHTHYLDVLNLAWRSNEQLVVSGICEHFRKKE